MMLGFNFKTSFSASLTYQIKETQIKLRSIEMPEAVFLYQWLQRNIYYV